MRARSCRGATALRPSPAVNVGIEKGWPHPPRGGGRYLRAMADDPLTDELVGLVPPDLRDVSGHLLYTGRDAWTDPSPLYLMGVNPGGDPDVIRETVTSSTERILRREAANWSAYRDDRWTHPSGDTRPPGTAPMQQNVLHMLSTLGLDPGTVPASNLVFVRSRAEGDIPRQQMRALAEACWPFHRGVIDRLGIRGKPLLSNELMQPQDRGSFGGIWPDVQDLRGGALREGDQPQFPGCGHRLVGGHFVRETCKQGIGDGVRLAEHHGPVPLRLVAGQERA